eukprot:CAMPEP_0177432136 /NCGR_PEP_ID=MMETSP0368-20130122/76540_1 /TAXON_ID=447022 ORGANISM="Scrippsiella hangoei-like, Strain SHHI-4" /NCGR_SAMPLE_ID=MMETSP0368 /ASSEMBLY_ACC=CAM_ASM_000363 /LENGTH=242 /DNA_ID=CAMNT_0018902799 /DNA_START=360 /DNA_END=1089 /DNA_ORIENTATION=+
MPNSAFGCNTGPSEKQLSSTTAGACDLSRWQRATHAQATTSVGGNAQAMQEKLAEHLSMHYRTCSPGLGESGSAPTPGIRRLTGGVRRLLQCDGLAAEFFRLGDSTCDCRPPDNAANISCLKLAISHRMASIPARRSRTSRVFWIGAMGRAAGDGRRSERQLHHDRLLRNLVTIVALVGPIPCQEGPKFSLYPRGSQPAPCHPLLEIAAENVAEVLTTEGLACPSLAELWELLYEPEKICLR